MPTKQQVIDQARRSVGTVENATHALSAVSEAPSGGGLESMGGGLESLPTRAPRAGAAVVESSPVQRAVAEERRQVVADGIEGMKKIELGRADDIRPHEQAGLEAIILLTGRPALLIQDGTFMEPPPLWADLKTARDQIDSVIARVGRIEVSGNPNFDWLGTGFLVSADVVVTNRHVAMEFAKNESDGTWKFRSPMGSSVDFKEEFGSGDSLAFDVKEIIGIHDDYDMALLRVEQTSGHKTLPEPLPVAAAAPAAAVTGRKVYVIGYPAWDGRRNDPEPMRRIFSDIYNVKRLQPGQVSGETLASFEIQHDCSTLGGNSGSPVIDLETHRVLALHFGGRYMENNHAIPLWLLQSDPLVQRAQLNFQ